MSTTETAPAPPEEIQAVPVRHYGRWLAAIIVIYIAVWAVLGGAHNSKLGWHIVNQFFTESTIVKAIGVTLELTVFAMAIGVAGGILLAVLRLSPNPVVSGAAWFYVWFFRGTPVFVQILAWEFLGAVLPQPHGKPDLGIGIPFGPTLAHIDYNAIVTPFLAGVLALGLNEAAYMSEIVRAGLLSVDPGQTEAAQALGMSRLQTLRRIVLPQAMRVIIPPTGNETISMLKTSSLVSVIGVAELTYTVQIIYGRTYQQIPMLLVASIWYLIMTSVLSVGQFFLERRFGRGAAQRETMLERMFGNLRARRPVRVAGNGGPPQ